MIFCPLSIDSGKQVAWRGSTPRHRFGLISPRLLIEVCQYLPDHRRILDTGDHPHRTAAFAAGVNVDVEHPLEPLCPTHRSTALGRRLIGITARFLLATPRWRHCGLVLAVRGEYTVKAGEVGTRLRHQCHQP